MRVPGYLEEGGRLDIDTAARLVIRPPGPRWRGLTEFEIITGKRTAPCKMIDIRMLYKMPPHNLFGTGLYAVKNRPGAIKQNMIQLIVEAERPKQTDDRWHLERYCGSNRRMMIPDAEHPFILKPQDEVNHHVLGPADGYVQAFEELMIPDRLVVRRSLLASNDTEVSDADIPEIVSTQSICLLPVTVQLNALKALEPLLAAARANTSAWTDYDAFTCPW